jgi:hypothetical protein
MYVILRYTFLALFRENNYVYDRLKDENEFTCTKGEWTELCKISVYHRNLANFILLFNVTCASFVLFLHPSPPSVCKVCNFPNYERLWRDSSAVSLLLLTPNYPAARKYCTSGLHWTPRPRKDQEDRAPWRSRPLCNMAQVGPVAE